MKLSDLEKKGVQYQIVDGPQMAQPSIQSQPPQGNRSVGGFLGNAVSSAANLIGNTASAIIHPYDTVSGIAHTAAGGLEKAAGAITGRPINSQDTQMFDHLTNFFKNRYGSVENIKNTLYTDPIGVAADLSAALGGVGSALGAAGKIGDVSELAKAGQVASRAGELTNPLNAPGKLGELAGSGLEKLQPQLERYSLRLTPTQKATLGDRVGEVAQFIGKAVPVGSPEARYETVTSIYNDLEKGIQSTLQSSELQHVAGGIPKADFVSKLSTVPDAFRNDTAIFPQIDRQIREVIKTINTTQPDVIPLSSLNDAKRSFYKIAFDNLGTQVRSEVRAAAADAYKTAIEEALNQANINVKVPTRLRPLFNGATEVPIQEYNRVYGTVITARKLLKIATGKPELGFFGRIVSGLVGGSVGGVMGGPVGAGIGAATAEVIAPRVAGTATRAAIGKATSKTGQILVKTPKVSPAATAVIRASTANHQR